VLQFVIKHGAGLATDGSGLGRYETGLITDGTGLDRDGTGKGTREGREHSIQNVQPDK
jgi:hypothetical protein